MHGQEGLVDSHISEEMERWLDAARPPRRSPPVRKTMQTLNPKEIGEGVTGMDTQQRQDGARSTTK